MKFKSQQKFITEFVNSHDSFGVALLLQAAILEESMNRNFGIQVGMLQVFKSIPYHMKNFWKQQIRIYLKNIRLLGKKLDSVTGAELKSWYDIYCQIGGYPSVVREYLNSKSIERARSELIRIIDTFMNESIRYFTDVLDTQVFTDIFLSICRILGREKKGLEEDSISEELQKLVTRDYSSNISKAVCNRAISWLRFCGVIGFCGKIIEMDILNFKPGCRCYFMDLGLASYYMARVGAAQTEIAGMLSENFVYINLKKRQDFPEEIAFEMPAFATFKGGEVDFVVQGLKSSRRYAIEVKTGKHIGNTAKKVLESGKADCLLYLKGDTLGGQEGKIETVPIYLLEKLNF